MFYIRVDGNEIIATGHVMRCLSIAKEVKRQGEDVTFIIADRTPANMILEQDFSIICLDSIWNDMNQEIEKMIHLIQENDISMLFIDSYYVTEKYLQELRKYTKIAYLDDLNRFLYPVDYLINYNMYADRLDYQERYLKAGLHTEFLLGCSYAPLREEFSKINKTINPRMKKVLITTGGTDNYNMIGHLLSKLSGQDVFSELEFKVILGKFNKRKEFLLEQWGSCDNVDLLENVSNMADYMKECDMAITAGGVTTYELCACGIPAVMYTLADNQLDIAKTVSDMELIPWVGDIRGDMDGCLDRMVECLISYKTDYTRRKVLSCKMQSIVDGLGCRRLVEGLGFVE